MFSDIIRTDGSPIKFDTTNKNDFVRIDDAGLGIEIDPVQALHVTGNAIFMGNILINQHFVFSELSTSPATPSSGNGILYVKNDGKLYFKNDSGTESDLTTGGGGGAFSVSGSDAYYTAGDVGINDSTPSYKLDVNGTFRVTGAATFDSTVSTGALTATTINTGQGANELYDMNQNVQTTDAVVFATINTGQGANELYDMNQDVTTGSAVVFASLNTGQGAYELYDMNQDVMTNDAVTFDAITSSGVVSIDETTDSSSTITGSLHTDGGLGIAKKIVVGNGAVINESGANSDTRFESDTNANMFFIDASADRIGIGTNTPDNLFDIEQASRSGSHVSGEPLYVTGNFGAHSSGVEFRHSNATQGIGIGYDGIYAAGSNGSQDIKLQAKGTSSVVFNIDGSNQDFRVESNNDQNMFFLDASADMVGIKDSSPSYVLDINGTFRVTGATKFDDTFAYGVQNVTSNTTLGSTSMVLVDTSSGSVTITVPAASTETGRVYRIKKIDSSNTVTVVPASGTIDGGTGKTLASGSTPFINLISDGSNWSVLSHSASGVTGLAWTPASLSQLDLWLDASDSNTITKDGSNYISDWNDKSGNTNHATQSGSGIKPLWVSAAQNSLDVIRFDGSNDYFNVSGLGSAIGDVSVFVVIKWNTKANLDTIFGTDGGWAAGAFHYIYHNTGDAIAYSQHGQSDRKGDTHAQSTSSFQILGAVSEGSGSGSSLNHYYNGKDNDTFSNQTLPTKNLANFNIGSWDTSRYLDADIAEMIIVEDNLSTADREKVEGYLAHKWGLEGDLDAGHTYKSEAP